MLAGAGVAVTRAGNPVWTRGFGVKNQAIKALVDQETVFQAASLSKPVFAYAVLAFVAEGKFDLDKPLTEYVTQPFRSRMKGLMAS